MGSVNKSIGNTGLCKTVETQRKKEIFLYR